MNALSSNSDRSGGLTENDAYRAYLISRNQNPIVYHSGEMHLKRLRVVLRRAGNRVRGFPGSMHLALLAARVRRIRFESAERLVHLRAAAVYSDQHDSDMTRGRFDDLHGFNLTWLHPHTIDVVGFENQTERDGKK